jgi:hypothetical protein
MYVTLALCRLTLVVWSQMSRTSNPNRYVEVEPKNYWEDKLSVR